MGIFHNKEKIREWSLILAWGMYDLANQFFAVIIISLYFIRWLTIEKGAPEFFYSLSFGISTFLVAILAPILGAISDITKKRMPFLIFFTLLSVIFTMLLGVSESIFVGLCFFAIANFGCQLAIVFYNALMVNIAPQNKIGLVSGLGRMLGYSGAILALYLIKPIVLKSGYQATFFPAGFYFLIFSLPCMLFIKDKLESSGLASNKPEGNGLASFGQSHSQSHKYSPESPNLTSYFKKAKLFELFAQSKDAIFNAYKLPLIANFLKSAFFGLCVVNVIILFMSVYATKVFQLNELQIINLIAFSSLFAMLGSIASGYISDYIGASLSLKIVLILWGACLVIGAFAKTTSLYWLVGALAGTALGSTWAVSRALAVRLVPAEKTAEIFGLFFLISSLSAIAGALFWGIILLFLSPLGEWGYRIALLSLNLFIILAFIFLLRIPNKK